MTIKEIFIIGQKMKGKYFFEKEVAMVILQEVIKDFQRGCGDYYKKNSNLENSAVYILEVGEIGCSEFTIPNPRSCGYGDLVERLTESIKNKLTDEELELFDLLNRGPK